MVRKNFVGAPLLKENHLRAIFLTLSIVSAYLAGLTNNLLFLGAFVCFLICHTYYHNKYIDRVYDMKEEWK